jgi:hypothetical protein
MPRLSNVRQEQSQPLWLELLRQFTADEVDSKQYVERSLSLLSRHKEDLRFKLSGFNEGKEA